MDTTIISLPDGTDVEVRRRGSGPPLLFLHGADGILFCEPFLSRLEQQFEVIVPHHPRWGQSPRAQRCTTVDDLAYVHLDLLEALESVDRPVPVVGASLGAWIALEMAVKDRHALGPLVLVSPLGIKFSGHTTREFLDLYASSRDEVREAMYADDPPDLSTLSDEEFLYLARAQEAATLYTWEPYQHRPALGHLLHRVAQSTLVVSGARDGFILRDDHGQLLAKELGARHEALDTGHRVEEQAPDELATLIEGFLA